VGTPTPTVARGDIATVSGTYTSFRGLEQIDVRTGSVTGTGTGTLPTPIVVVPSDIATGGPHALDYQSMLLQVNTVTATNATTGTDFNVLPAGMCATPGGLLVTSFLVNDTAASSFPATTCQTYSSITGVLYMNGPTAGPFDAKLAPRDTADIVTP
jgi:hypothetical protein